MMTCFLISQSNRPAIITNPPVIDVDKLLSNLADPTIKLRSFPSTGEQSEGRSDDNETREV